MDSLDKILQNDRYKDDLEDHLSKAFIDMTREYKSPLNAVTVLDSNEYQRLFTLGNISTISGKQKSKKTWLTSLLIAAASSNNMQGDKFHTALPENKSLCFYFDTEQAIYDAWKVGKQIQELGGDLNNVNLISLREFSPKDRLEIINYAVEKYGNRIGYMVIDGIADLVNSINDELEAVEITTRMMRWTANYNIHCSVVIHQRKADNYARGHIGTAIMNKSEAVISVTKSDEHPSVSTVKCTDIRGAAPFTQFEIEIVGNRLEVNEIGYVPKSQPGF